jgi:hypothetical protein
MRYECPLEADSSVPNQPKETSRFDSRDSFRAAVFL